VHGDEDKVVPMNQSELLDEALRKAGVESTLIPVAGSGHGGPAFMNAANRKRIEEFFAKHLKQEACSQRPLTIVTARSPGGTSRTNPAADEVSLTPGSGFESAQAPGTSTVTVPPGKGCMSRNAGGWRPCGNSTVSSPSRIRKATGKSAAKRQCL
jgi:hypothetical protein